MSAGPAELPGVRIPRACFLSQDLRAQLEDSTRLNSELKQQMAVAELRNALLQAEREELRASHEQIECGRRLAEEELLKATGKKSIFSTPRWGP